MPEDIQLAIEDRALMDEYLARPVYQQYDYIEWVARARSIEERDRRLSMMLDELAEGVAYMSYPFSAKV